MDADAELVDRLRAGDEAAFATLVQRYHPPLLRLAQSTVGSRAVAEEAVQDTWLAVVRGVDRFEGRSSLKTWLFHILVNRARSAGGREARTGGLHDELDEAGPFDAAGRWAEPPEVWADRVDDRIVAQHLADRVTGLLVQLPEVQRQVVLLRDVEGLPAKDVAALLGLTDVHQRVLLHRGRARLRALLEAEVGRQ
jgi:RNA polymerase sigma-70 factor, ECF subfamily